MSKGDAKSAFHALFSFVFLVPSHIPRLLLSLQPGEGESCRLTLTSVAVVELFLVAAPHPVTNFKHAAKSFICGWDGTACGEMPTETTETAARAGCVCAHMAVVQERVRC